MFSETQRNDTKSRGTGGVSRRRVLKTAGALGFVGVAGCVSGDDGDGGDGEPDGTDGEAGSDDSGNGGETVSDAVALELVADGESIPDGPARPLAYEMPADTGGIGYIGDQDGKVYVTDEGELQEEPLLDI